MASTVDRDGSAIPDASHGTEEAMEVSGHHAHEKGSQEARLAFSRVRSVLEILSAIRRHSQQALESDLVRSPFVWECHDCHNGVIVPGPFQSSHGEILSLDPENLPPNTLVLRF